MINTLLLLLSLDILVVEEEFIESLTVSVKKLLLTLFSFPILTAEVVDDVDVVDDDDA
jgi:hypothetical protein